MPFRVSHTLRKIKQRCLWVSKCCLNTKSGNRSFVLKRPSTHGHCATDIVRRRFNAVNFLINNPQRHPIARPPGRGMGCLLWVQPLINILPEFLQLFMQYLTILDRAIMALDCRCARKLWSIIGLGNDFSPIRCEAYLNWTMREFDQSTCTKLSCKKCLLGLHLCNGGAFSVLNRHVISIIKLSQRKA